MKRGVRTRPILYLLASVAVAGAAWAQDPGAQEVQRNLQKRQQQQDELQLRMQQQQRSLQDPPADAAQQRSVRQLEIEQRLQQEELHYRQNINQPPASITDDEGTRRAKSQIEQDRARQQSEQQLRRFDWR